VALVAPDVLSDWHPGDASEDSSDVVASPGQQPRYYVNARQPCILVMSEVDYPWWRASVDDVPVEIARVDHALIGVPVPSGTHLVRLRLQPVSVWTGGAISLACMLLWVAIGLASRRATR
jgi:hypothetical protein